MNEGESPLVVHVGYPKTATTTFQQHVFPYHPEIDYLGKFIPSFRYKDDRLYDLIDALIHRSSMNFSGMELFRAVVSEARASTLRKCVLISSESFIHPSAIDISTVADRLHAASYPCRILITIREQISAILSYYWMHGRYGQYLTIGSKAEADRIDYPISFRDWIRLQNTARDRNYLGTLHYDVVIDCYRQRFGAPNVCVLLYEELKRDPQEYSESLGAFLGVDVPMILKLLGDNHELSSRGHSSRWERQNTDTSAAALRRTFSDVAAWLFGRQDRTLMESELSKLREIYRPGNARLSQSLMLPLEQFGYAT